MVRSNTLVPHPLPKHCWPSRQKERLEKPGATDAFLSPSSTLCKQMQASVPEQERTKVFHYLTEAVQSICETREFIHKLSVFRDMKVTDSPGGSAGPRSGSKPRHRAIAVGYNPITLSRGEGSLFPLDSPVPCIEDLRMRRHDAIMEASFLLVGDSASRAFRGSAIPVILQSSLLAMGPENFDMVDPMKAFQSSSFNDVGCPLGLLSHLTYIYQCEIRDDGKITLSVIWAKLLQDDEEGSNDGIEGGTYRLQYCKAAIDSFNVMDPRQAAKLFAWLHSIAQWSLKQRVDALRMAQQLDEVRQRRFQQANISLLQEFGADLSTTWLSEQILKSIPGPTTLERQSVRIGRSQASTRSKSLQSRSKKDLQSYPPPPPRQATPPPTIAWKGLLPAHKLAGFPKVDGASLPTRSQTSSTADIASSPSGREVSADKFMASRKDKQTQRELTQKLMVMTAIYEKILQSPDRGQLLADLIQAQAPVSVS